jgi:hypothetical protein
VDGCSGESGYEEDENMKTRNKILIGVGIVVLLVVGFYVIFPFYLVGPPLPLLSLKNEDVSSHEVVIEIFDQNNKSIFKETYELDPEEEIRHPRPFLLKFRWLKECTLKVTVDNNTTEMCKTDVYSWKEFCITIGKDPVSGEMNIGIGAIVV